MSPLEYGRILKGTNVALNCLFCYNATFCCGPIFVGFDWKFHPKTCVADFLKFLSYLLPNGQKWVMLWIQETTIKIVFSAIFQTLLISFSRKMNESYFPVT